MKFILTKTGDFDIPEEIISEILADRICYETIRTNPIFIDWVYSHPESCFRVAEIPEEATDWELFPDDGPEGIIAVIDGKLKFI